MLNIAVEHFRRKKDESSDRALLSGREKSDCCGWTGIPDHSGPFQNVQLRPCNQDAAKLLRLLQKNARQSEQGLKDPDERKYGLKLRHRGIAAGRGLQVLHWIRSPSSVLYEQLLAF